MADPRAEQVREWLLRAAEDLRAAEVLNETSVFAPSLFHCQQAAEKALKALFVWHDQPFGKTHDLVALVDEGRQVLPSLADHTEAAAALTPLASLFRYPGADVEPGHEDVTSALDYARGIYEFVLTHVPGESHP